MMAGEAAFGPDVSTGGWERALYVFPFCYGFLIASDPRLENALRRSRWPALAVACAATGLLLSWAGALSRSSTGLSVGVPPGWSALQGLGRLGVDRGHHRVRRIRHYPSATPCRPGRTPGPPRRPGPGGSVPPGTATKPSCPSTFCMSQSSWRPPGSSSAGTPPFFFQYAALVAGSFAATLGLYELALIRRFRITRLLSGMKPRTKPVTRPCPATVKARVGPAGGARWPARGGRAPLAAVASSRLRRRRRAPPPAPSRPRCSASLAWGRDNGWFSLPTAITSVPVAQRHHVRQPWWLRHVVRR